MPSKSKIQWTEVTWNPIAGCRKISAGCDNCYAIRSARRMGSNPNESIQKAYAGLTTRMRTGKPNWTGEIRFLSDRLRQPLEWKKPRRVFVNSMSDLFHPTVTESYIQDVFAIMLKANQHTFQVLTKRAGRMLSVLEDIGYCSHARLNPEKCAHIWLGVSAENQKCLIDRVPYLAEIPATVRWLSCEPLLDSIEIDCGAIHSHSQICLANNQIHWVVVGGESGPGARPMDVRWPERLRKACEKFHVPFFMKQMSQVDYGLRYKEFNEFPKHLRVREYPNVQQLLVNKLKGV